MAWWSEVVRPMQVQLTRPILIAAVAILYVLVALPLPYLLVDHYSAMQAGETSHSDVDIHAWLEWAASFSFSGTVPVVPSVSAPSLLSAIPAIPVFARLLDVTSSPRGPPAAMSSYRAVLIHSLCRTVRCLV